jgi:hypothetical protein
MPDFYQNYLRITNVRLTEISISSHLIGSQSHIATDSQLVSQSLCPAPCRKVTLVTVWQLQSCYCGAPSLTRGQVCLLSVLGSSSAPSIYVVLARDPLRWPRDTLYQLNLALTSPAGCGRSVGIVRLLTNKPRSLARDNFLNWLYAFHSFKNMQSYVALYPFSV